MIKRDIHKITVNPAGKIKTGYKGKSAKGIDIPKKADGFILTNPETAEVLFPELQHYYGNCPDKLFIAFPSGNWLDVYSDSYNLYGSNEVKKRDCDGEECTHLADESFELENGKKCSYLNGTITQCVCKLDELFTVKDKDKRTKHCCKVSMYMKAWVLNPKTGRPIHPLPYLFESHSINSANNISGMLSMFKSLHTASGEPIPFSLILKKVKKTDKSYILWQIYPVLSSQALINVADQTGLLEQNLLQIEQGEDASVGKPDIDIAKIADKIPEEKTHVQPDSINQAEKVEEPQDESEDDGGELFPDAHKPSDVQIEKWKMSMRLISQNTSKSDDERIRELDKKHAEIIATKGITAGEIRSINFYQEWLKKNIRKH